MYHVYGMYPGSTYCSNKTPFKILYRHGLLCFRHLSQLMYTCKYPQCLRVNHVSMLYAYVLL
jgi:hypothetical protein